MSSATHVNVNLRALCKEGRLKEALHILLNTHSPSPVDSSTYVHLLKACIAEQEKAILEGKQIHSHIKSDGRGSTFASNTTLQNTLIKMYDQCGSLVDAREVFENMTERDAFSWNLIIGAHRRHGLPQQALMLFHQMQRTGVKSDEFTLSIILPVCTKLASFKQGLQVHGRIIRCGFECSVNVINTLIDMYSKCGSIDKARKVFDKMPQRDVVSWTAIVDGYAKCGSVQKAREVFDKMPQRNVVSWNAMITGYAQCGSIENARELFDKMPQRNVVSWNAMVTGYAQNGGDEEALRLFREMPQRNVVSWTAIISGCAQNGILGRALDLFEEMQLGGVKPNSLTFASVLSGCAKMGALEEGVKIHNKVMECGLTSDVVVANALIDMYAKCGSVQKAQEVFDKMPQRNVVSWTAIISGYAQKGVFSEALRLFKEMPQRNVVSWNAIIAGYVQNGLFEKASEFFTEMKLAGIKPNSSTLASILPAFAKLGALKEGVEIHRKVTECGLQCDVVVVNALIDMYAKCGSIEKAEELFDKMPQRDEVSWTAIIVGYAQNGVLDKALRLFKEMPQRDVASWNAIIAGYAQNGLLEKASEIFEEMQFAGVKPNSSTFASILPVCANLGALQEGMEIHRKVIECGYLHDIVVANALIYMYAKCGNIEKANGLFDKMLQRDVVSWNAIVTGYAQNGFLEDALRLFKEMPERDVTSWTAIIAGYAQNGLLENALDIFKEMQWAGIKPDSSTFASILPACAKTAALERGMRIHKIVIESGLLSDVVVANALIGMYAKCGNIEKARELFDTMPEWDVISWSAMIAGYGMHGYGKDALKLFEVMKHSATKPNHISFICVLFACSHSGLVDDACKYFSCMSDTYGIMPIQEHYVHMVDLLGRAGYLEEALNFIVKMPLKPTVVLWMSLLGACRSYKNIALGEFVGTNLFELDPKNAATFILLSNMYAEVGRWGDVQKVRKWMKDGGIKKIPGCSWIEAH